MSLITRRTWVFIISTFVLNLIWELLQGELGFYEGHGGDIVSMALCARAAIGDVFIVAGIYALMTIIYRTRTWIFTMSKSTWVVLVLVSISVAILVEWWGIYTGRWSYSDLMPIIPFLSMGVTPILQMTILVPIITLIVKK